MFVPATTATATAYPEAVIAYSSGSTNWCGICDVREQLSYNCLKRWRS